LLPSLSRKLNLRLARASQRRCALDDLMALIFKPTNLGSGKLYEVLDYNRRSIGRIMLHPQASPGQPWFRKLAVGIPQYPHSSVSSDPFVRN
jgi:hypothetical protein